MEGCEAGGNGHPDDKKGFTSRSEEGDDYAPNKVNTLSMNPQILKGTPEKQKLNLCVNMKGDKHDCMQIKC